MAKKIYVTRKIPDAGLKLLRDRGYELDINPKDRMLSKKELVKALSAKPYDAVLSLLTDNLDKEAFDACPTAKMYANYAVGFNNINLEDAKARGITVSNTPGEIIGDVVADHTFAFILALARNILPADSFVRKGKYAGWDPMIFLGMDLAGATLGLLGTGKIGQEVAKKALAFRMKVIYYDVRRNEAIEKETGARFCPAPEEVFREADFVSFHVPLLPATHHMANEKTLAMMKKTAYLINTARGPVVDENALVAALKNGTIAGAGIDVFEFEPKLARGLAKLPNVILSPHTASASIACRDFMAVTAAENIIAFFTGQVPPNAVR